MDVPASLGRLWPSPTCSMPDFPIPGVMERMGHELVSSRCASICSSITRGWSHLPASQPGRRIYKASDGRCCKCQLQSFICHKLGAQAESHVLSFRAFPTEVAFGELGRVWHLLWSSPSGQQKGGWDEGPPLNTATRLCSSTSLPFPLQERVKLSRGSLPVN